MPAPGKLRSITDELRLMALKEHWRSGFGFVLAAAGSAVGLGNLWGFAYRASQGGGGACLLLYVLRVVLVCLPVLGAAVVQFPLVLGVPGPSDAVLGR